MDQVHVASEAGLTPHALVVCDILAAKPTPKKVKFASSGHLLSPKPGDSLSAFASNQESNWREAKDTITTLHTHAALFQLSGDPLEIPLGCIYTLGCHRVS